jgi:hypothetical protein
MDRTFRQAFGRSANREKDLNGSSQKAGIFREGAHPCGHPRLSRHYALQNEDDARHVALGLY